MGSVLGEKKYDLEEGLIDYGVQIVRIVNGLPSTRVGNYIGGQLIRSGLAPSLNYGEAQAAESRADFIHKLKIVLKELRETSVSLRFPSCLNLTSQGDMLGKLLMETNELISIFVKSIETARKNSR